MKQGAKRLEIQTLGGLQIRLGNQPLKGFRSRKAEAMLVYLALQRKPVSREILAERFWSDGSQNATMANLRVVLSNLRQILDPFITVSRDAAGMDQDAGIWVDVTELEAALYREDYERVLGLYQGEFLQGFYAPDNAAFDQWVTEIRENCRRMAISAAQSLVANPAWNTNPEKLLALAQRWTELDRLSENAQLEYMKLLHRLRGRSEVITHYNGFCRTLVEELGFAPSAAILDFIEKVKIGNNGNAPSIETSRTRPLPAPPRSIDPEAVFVGRAQEMNRLFTALEQTMRGQGQLIFLAGEAGSGKSALVQAFLRQAQTAQPDLLAVTGMCHVFSGTGDPFLPFRDVLLGLIGDEEALRASSRSNPETARRIARALPATVPALIQSGPDLVGTLLSPGALSRHVSGDSQDPWAFELADFLQQRNKAGPQRTYDAGDIYSQVSRFLSTIAGQQPLVLVLEDLHWADASSVSLLSYLSLRVTSSPILIIGTYRPEALAARREQEHPLETALHEWKRQFGDCAIDLDAANDRDAGSFVRQVLDTLKHHLTDEFLNRFSNQTGGHPLFTIELLRHMQERGMLLLGSDGCWDESSALSWEDLPAKVEGVLDIRLGQIDSSMRAVLSAASIEGEAFTAEIAAQVAGQDPDAVVRRLGRIARNLHIVVEGEVRQVNGRRLSGFRFRHSLFSTYLYKQLSTAERAYYHEQVAQAMEQIYTNDPRGLAEMAPVLAFHFREAGRAGKAIDYFQMAASHAALIGALEDAIRQLRAGLQLLSYLTDENARRRLELALQLALIAPLQALKGYADPELRAINQRIRTLCNDGIGADELLPALVYLRTNFQSQTERIAAQELAQRIVSAPPGSHKPLVTTLAHWVLGSEKSYQGSFLEAKEHLEQVIQTYDPRRDRWLIPPYGHDPGVSALGRLAWVMWFLGYPNQAAEYSRRSLALAQELNHPLARGFAIGRSGVLFNQIIGEPEQALEWNKISRQDSEEKGIHLFRPSEELLRGWIESQIGEVAEGLRMMETGIRERDTSGATRHRPHYLGLLATGYQCAGRFTDGLRAVEQALASCDLNGEWYYQAELLRIQGSLFIDTHNLLSAEDSLHRSLEVARRQSAKSWELRAALSLCNLWRSQGKIREARDLILEEYNWFSEGFSTPDLLAAKALIADFVPTCIS
jgi:DNA-binding SARP family transcriptional activator/predicted ATPase